RWLFDIVSSVTTPFPYSEVEYLGTTKLKGAVKRWTVAIALLAEIIHPLWSLGCRRRTRSALRFQSPAPFGLLSFGSGSMSGFIRPNFRFHSYGQLSPVSWACPARLLFGSQPAWSTTRWRKCGSTRI